MCLAGGDAISLRGLTVDQVALLLEVVDLGDYVTHFRAAGVNGDTLHICRTRDELKEVKGIDIPDARFDKLRAAVEGLGRAVDPNGIGLTVEKRTLDMNMGDMSAEDGAKALNYAMAHRPSVLRIIPSFEHPHASHCNDRALPRQQPADCG